MSLQRKRQQKVERTRDDMVVVIVVRVWGGGAHGTRLFFKNSTPPMLIIMSVRCASTGTGALYLRTARCPPSLKAWCPRSASRRTTQDAR